MSTRTLDFTGRSLLAVFAHPDDEALACGGLLAWCAQLGARVSLLCASRGEHGRPGGDDLGATRARELDAAARVLGVTDVMVLEHEDGMLPWVEAAALEADIAAAIRRLQPDVVITFGEDGLYWHPDHIAVHDRTTAAVAGLGASAPALFYVTMPPGRMRAVVDLAATRSPAPSRLGILGVADADAFGTLAPAPTLAIEAGLFAVRKLAAIKCHHSQRADDALHALSDDDAVGLLGTEHFRRAIVGSQRDAFIERLAANLNP
jgi:LmbE family N-acetylglucosaminyl deacetylase